MGEFAPDIDEQAALLPLFLRHKIGGGSAGIEDERIGLVPRHLDHAIDGLHRRLLSGDQMGVEL
jgi:hypothetical protein